MTKKEKLMKLKNALRETNKKLGIEDAVKYGKDIKDWEKLSTGVPSIDELFGGGFPYGHFSVIWGGEGAGKSSLCYSTVAEAQKNGKIVYYIDLEEKFNAKRAKDLFGVNLDDLIIGEFPIAENSLDTIIDYSRKKIVDVIVLDSIHSLSPKGEQQDKKGDKSVEADTMALLARKLSQFFRMAVNPVAKGNVAVIMVGQTRTSVGFIALEQLTGGNALKHYSVLTANVRRGQKCYSKDTRILTKKGIKGIEEIKIGDIIPTVNLRRGKIEYKPIKNIFKYQNENYLHHYYNKVSNGFLFTNDHKLLIKDGHKKGKGGGYFKQDKYKIISSNKSLKKKRSYAIPICYKSGNKKYKISNDELKFVAWCLTDSWISKNGYSLELYQSQNKYYKNIETILNNLKIDYKKKIKISSGFKSNFEQYTYRIKKCSKYIKKYNLKHDKVAPDWLFNLSDKQMKIFFDELIKANGSFRNKSKNYWRGICQDNRKILEKLAILAVTHNISISKIYKDKTKNAHYLEFILSNYRGYNKKQEKYNDIIWGIEVENSLHFIERNGQIAITHNSDAPKETITEQLKTKKKKKQIITGFDCKIKLNKTQCPDSKPELTEIHLPYYMKSGFYKEDK